MSKQITIKINEILNKKGLTGSKLAKMIGITNGAMYSMINGESTFSQQIIDKIAPILEISPEIIKGWMLADKYHQNAMILALEVKQSTKIVDNKLILTTKIDEILNDKGISRTGLSKLINYSQGKLNEMIIGKKPMSRLVISKISSVLNISENEIISWIIADKYSLLALEAASRD